jgi:hypothetical protein
MRIAVLVGIVASAWTAVAVAQTTDKRPQSPAAVESERPNDMPSPSMAKITELIQAYAFKSNPNLNPQTEFRVRETKVKGLWDAMKLRVFTLDECDSDTHTPFNQFLCVYHNGKVQWFGHAFGGSGLTSGVVVGDKFYYTCSFGSGRRLSQVGRIEVRQGKVRVVESEALSFDDADLLLSIGAQGAVRVIRGTPKGFNQWENESDYGTLDEKNPNLLRINKAASADNPGKNP